MKPLRAEARHDSGSKQIITLKTEVHVKEVNCQKVRVKMNVCVSLCVGVCVCDFVFVFVGVSACTDAIVTRPWISS